MNREGGQAPGLNASPITHCPSRITHHASCIVAILVLAYAVWFS